MRWTLIQSTNQLHYWRLEQDEYSTEIKYNHPAQSFRQTAGDKRLFFIEKTGFLRHKFLIRTEYSVIAGEILPLRNWHSGMVIFEEKKYHFFLKGCLLTLASKKQDFFLSIEIADSNSLNPSEFYALLFGTVRVFTRTYKTATELVFD
jgi:hypothetical protein